MSDVIYCTNDSGQTYVMPRFAISQNISPDSYYGDVRDLVLLGAECISVQTARAIGWPV